MAVTTAVVETIMDMVGGNIYLVVITAVVAMIEVLLS